MAKMTLQEKLDPVPEKLMNVLEASFADLARLHDALLAEACEHWAENDRKTNALEVVMAENCNAQMKLVRAVMELRFREAAAEWFR